MYNKAISQNDFSMSVAPSGAVQLSRPVTDHERFMNVYIKYQQNIQSKATEVFSEKVGVKIIRKMKPKFEEFI